MKTQQPILTTSIAAAADLTKARFVGFNGNVCAAGAKALGIAETDTGSGRQAPVNVLGILHIESGGAIAVGADVESNASGQAITKTAGVSNGTALDAASAQGEIIRIARGV